MEEEIQEIKPEVNSNIRYIVFGLLGLLGIFVVVGKTLYNKGENNKKIN